MSRHVLLMTASLPYPPQQGGALRVLGILYGLAAAGYRITLLSFSDSVTTSDTPLAAHCDQIALVPPPKRTRLQRLRDLIFSRKPDIEGRQQSPQMTQKLTDLLQSGSFDYIQFEGIEVAAYSKLARKLAPQSRIIYDAFNAEADLQRVIAAIDRQDIRRLPAAIYSTIQAQRLERFERNICQNVDAVVAVSEEDAKLLSQFRTDQHIYTVPNGIHFADYQRKEATVQLAENSLVFTGKMDYRPNVDAMLWFVEAILPIVQQQVRCHLYIVGQKPHSRLKYLHQHPDVTITGWVDSVIPYLRGAAVYIAPLRMGSGTRLKLLEAMASGCAIVATPIAAAGLQTDALEQISISDAPAIFADNIVALLQNPHQCQAIGEAAKQYVKNHYDWSVLIPKLLMAYEDLSQ